MMPPRETIRSLCRRDTVCRQFAEHQTSISPQTAAAEKIAGGAAIGTAAGALPGAAIGAAADHPRVGAAVGAGTGLLISTAAGTNAEYGAGVSLIACEQCMYAMGNQIPGVAPLSPPPPLNEDSFGARSRLRG